MMLVFRMGSNFIHITNGPVQWSTINATNLEHFYQSYISPNYSVFNVPEDSRAFTFWLSKENLFYLILFHRNLYFPLQMPPLFLFKKLSLIFFYLPLLFLFLPEEEPRLWVQTLSFVGKWFKNWPQKKNQTSFLVNVQLVSQSDESALMTYPGSDSVDPGC